jgi:prohibitin 2
MRTQFLGWGVLAVVALMFFARFSPFTMVQAGNRGVVTIFGKVDPTPLDEGFHWINPLAKVVQIDVRVARSDSEGEAASHDLQTVHTAITLNYRINPALVAKLYQEVGPGFVEKVIDPAVQETFKSVTARYTAEELITKREDVRSAVRSLLKEKIDARAVGALALDEVSITNFRFSDQFRQAIESKQEAEQLALKAQRDLERIQIEAKQRVATAEAEAASLRAQKQEITTDLLKLREIEVQSKAIDKWNGVLPATIAGGTVPFIGLSGSTR